MRLIAAMFAAAVMFAGCSEDGPSMETAIVTFEGEEWAPFVASSFGATYTGAVATADYVWEDGATSLTGPNIFSDGYFSGGWVVSSYNSNDLAAYGDYTTDLYVYNASNENATTRGGHNGSDTFLIGYGNKSEWGDFRPSLRFADGKARVVCGCYVNSTCYFLNIAKNGNPSAPAIAEGQKVIGVFNFTGEEKAVTFPHDGGVFHDLLTDEPHTLEGLTIPAYGFYYMEQMV